MKRPNLRLTLEREEARIEVLTKDVVAEIRDYRLQDENAKPSDRWVDENGRPCLRYFFAHKGGCDMPKVTASDLQRFADDLQTHAGIAATLTPDDSNDGLHVLTVNKVDYYFCADGGGYDGWGRQIDGGSS